MQLSRSTILSCLALVQFLSLQVAQAQSDGSAATAEERGKQDFVTYFCYSCHGFTGQGGQTDIAPRIRVDVLSADALIAYVRNPAGDMPPYRMQEQVPDSALRDIHAYLKSLPPSPAANDIPLLNQ